MLNRSENIILIIIINANNRKDAIIDKLQEKIMQNFLKLRDNYHNESLEEFVTNKNETTKIIEFKGEIDSEAGSNIHGSEI